MAYADVDDLEARWRPLTPEEQERAAVLLDDASAFLDGLVEPDRRVCGEADGVLRMVVCNMVQRAMVATSADAFGVSQQSMTAGPYTQSWTYANPSGDFYLTKMERRLLGVGTGYIGSIRPMIGRQHDNWH